MQLGLRAKLTMVMTALVLLTVTVLSTVFLEQLLQQVLHDTNRRANELAREVFDTASRADADAKQMGLRPASEDPQEAHDYLKRAFEISDDLSTRLKTASESPSIYEVSIVDRDDVVMVSSDPSQAGKTSARHPPFSQLVESPFVRQVRILAGRAHIYEVDFPFDVRKKPFGEIRVAVSTALLLNDIKPRLIRWGTLVALALVISTLLAAAVSGAALAPIRDILAQLERRKLNEHKERRGRREDKTMAAI